ncbi:MAG: hypothetical protein WCL23_02390 [Candidatus Moraniibacteriota bacterium]
MAIKRSTEIRLLTIAFVIVMLASSLFSVLFMEERKRVASQNSKLNDLFVWLQASEQARQKYYDGLTTEREKLRQQMAASKAQYDDLIAKQPDMVKSGQQQVTKVSNVVVPVQVPVTTTVKSAASSSRSTKTS